MQRILNQTANYMSSKFYTLLFLCLLATVAVKAQQVVNITDADLQAGQVYNWTNDKVYLLDGLVFLEPGGRLNIQAGTVVKFTDRADLGNPSALVITRGAQIYAEGTATAPIIFTAAADDVNNPTDLGPTDNALWGGIVILGSGITQKNGNAEVSVEGISTSEPRGLYGGNNNADNSGVLRYISIRHGGRQIASGSELNGLTLGAVGSGTTMEYIEVYANSDDGIEFFGGAPNLKHAVVAFAEDDSFDWDEVYTGKGQFWFSIQRPDIADAGGELDGTTPDDLTPYANPTVYNWTHIGSGAGAAASNPIGLLFRAGTAGTVANSIVTGMKNKAIEVQDKNAGVNDAHQKLLNGELRILSNVFWANGANTTMDATSTGIIRITSGQPTQDDPTGSALIAELVDNHSAIADPGIRSISRTQNNGLDPRPSANGAAYASNLASYPNDPFFTAVDYRGAFSAAIEDNWLAGWSTLARNGHLAPTVEVAVNCAAPATQTVNITDNDTAPGGNYFWTNDKVYVIDGLVFIEAGATLTIEAGTVIKFTDRADLGNPSALVVARGAKVYAEGTAECPIIFTAAADDVSNPLDLGPTDNALWGGIVILGSGVTQKNGNSEVSVEGISTAEPRGLYGGNNNADNSGVLRYASIRHGGRQIASGSELNGLTLGAVGSGTTLEYVEVYANSDDGIEFFGGAPNLKYAIVAFAEDDSYDWDEVYTGKGQFWFSIQRPDIADAGGELDGTTPDDLTPYSNPTVYNWTHIGSGPGAAASNPIGLLFRAGTAGKVANSIVTEMKNKAIEVQDKNAGVNDAHQKLLSGELQILSNVFWANGANTQINAGSTGIIRVTSGQPTQDDPTASALIAELVDNGSVVENPGIRSISRIQNQLLDPRPSANGAAYAGTLAAYPTGDAFFTAVDYRGAFPAEESGLWLRDWSTLWRNQHANLVTSVTQRQDDALLAKFQIFPNPAQSQAGLTIETTFEEEGSITIYALDGRQLRQMEVTTTGMSRANIGGLQPGMYVVKFTTISGRHASRLLVVQ